MGDTKEWQKKNRSCEWKLTWTASVCTKKKSHQTASWARAQISSRRLLIAMLEQQLELSRTAVKVADGKDEWSVAASPTVPSPVGVPRRCLAVFGPPAEDLIGAVIAAAAGHAWRGLVDLKPRLCRQGGDVKRADRVSGPFRGRILTVTLLWKTGKPRGCV